ncbi:hypothetical protein ACS0TY_035663 [Phlomoides rotata]
MIPNTAVIPTMNSCAKTMCPCYISTPRNTKDYDQYGIRRNQYFVQYPEIAWPINFMSCPYRLHNSSSFTQTNDCAPVLDSRHTYIKAGHMNASDVGDMCRIEVIVMTSWKFEDVKNSKTHGVNGIAGVRDEETIVDIQKLKLFDALQNSL